MQRNVSSQPCGYTFVGLLKACAKVQDVEQGLHIHTDVASMGLLESNPIVMSSLIDMYVKCGSLGKAIQVFDKLPSRDVVTWTALISGYVKHGHEDEALFCFERMQLDGVTPNAVTFVCTLKACSNLGDLKLGQEIHAEIVRQGLIESSAILGNILVDMYAKCGLLPIAKEVLDKLEIKSLVSKTALIMGYAEHGYGEETLECFEQMKRDGVRPDDVMLLCCLKACGLVRALDAGCELHVEIEIKGLLGKDITISNSLIDMYIKCGSLSEAQCVFDKLPVRNAVSWNVLISGYGECGNAEEVLNLSELMQLEGVLSTAVTLMCILKACGSVAGIGICQEIHSEIEQRGLLEGDCLIGSTLVDTYSTCNHLTSAQCVFDKLSVRDVFSWTALISGYAEQGHGEKALEFFENMQLDHVSPNVVTYVCTMKACGIIGALDKGRGLHMDVVMRGLLEHEIVVGNALMDMYVKCNCLSIAREVFCELPCRNEVSWGTLLAGYIENGYGHAALVCIEQMINEGIPQNAVTYTCTIQACGMTRDTVRGLEAHAEVERQGLSEKEVTIGNAVVDMYAKWSMISKAQEVFDRLPAPDICAWNTLIAGYSEYGVGTDALNIFELMQVKGVSPNAASYTHSLEACSNTRALLRGQELHTEVEIKGLMVREDLSLSSSLIVMYAKCGQLSTAQQLFNKLRVHDVVSWTALIMGYVDHGHDMEALTCLTYMQAGGVLPSSITFVWCLKACLRIGALDCGQLMHAEIERRGLLQEDIVVGNAVLNLYVKCGWLSKAHQIFSRLRVCDAASWTVLLAGYIEHGYSEKALLFFEKMQAAGIAPNAVTFICVLKACSSLRAIDRGIEIHAEIERHRLLRKDPAVINSLIGMYCKCGLLANARHVFDVLPMRDAVTWAILIAGYADHDHAEEVLKCYERMQFEGMLPNAATFVCALKSCSSIGAMDEGYKIHTDIERHGLVECNLFVGNALIDVYAKFGWYEKAQDLLQRLPVRDVVSWNALMAGYAQLGHSEKVLAYFDKMQEEIISPDSVTFNILLKACCREGLATKSQTYFEAMSKNYGILPTLEQQVYMIDVLGRVGQVDEAARLMKMVSSGCHRFVAGHTLLRASEIFGSLEEGKKAFKHALNLEEAGAIDHHSMAHKVADGDWLDENTVIAPNEAWQPRNHLVGRSTRTSFEQKLDSDSFELTKEFCHSIEDVLDNGTHIVPSGTYS